MDATKPCLRVYSSVHVSQAGKDMDGSMPDAEISQASELLVWGGCRVRILSSKSCLS